MSIFLNKVYCWLKLWLYSEQYLVVLDRLAVFDEDVYDGARHFGFDLVHEFHGLDDAQDVTALDLVATVDESRRIGRRCTVEGADDRRTDFKEI